MDENKFYFKNIENIYSNSGYFKRYGLDVWLTIIIIIVMLAIFLYFHTLNNIQIIRANWDNEKCNPLYLLYVPLIDPDPNTTPDKQIVEHFEKCTEDGIKDITSNQISNIFSQFNILNDIHNDFNSFSGVFSKLMKTLFTLLVKFISEIVDIIQKILMGFIRYAQTIKDLFDKFLGILVTNFFILMEVINIGIGIILNFASIMTVTVVTPLLITLTGEIIMALSFFVIGLAFSAIFFLAWLAPGFFGIAAAITLTAVGTAILLGLALFFGALLIKIQQNVKKNSFSS